MHARGRGAGWRARARWGGLHREECLLAIHSFSVAGQLGCGAVPLGFAAAACSPDADTSRLSEQGWKLRSKILALWPALAGWGWQRREVSSRSELGGEGLYICDSTHPVRPTSHPGRAPYPRRLRPPAKLSTTASTTLPFAPHLRAQKCRHQIDRKFIQANNERAAACLQVSSQHWAAHPLPVNSRPPTAAASC